MKDRNHRGIVRKIFNVKNIPHLHYMKYYIEFPLDFIRRKGRKDEGKK